MVYSVSTNRKCGASTNENLMNWMFRICIPMDWWNSIHLGIGGAANTQALENSIHQGIEGTAYIQAQKDTTHIQALRIQHTSRH